MTPACVEVLVLNLIRQQRFQRLESVMRSCARSLGSPANAVLVEALNRIHERIVWEIAAQPDVLAAFDGNLVEAACSAGFPKWDPEQGHSLTDVIAYLRDTARTMPAVH